LKNTNELMVAVRDDGTGIDPVIMPRLFTKFAIKSEIGTGLGLYISKNINKALEAGCGLRIILMEKELLLDLSCRCLKTKGAKT
jgi:C4-dicarboxylate-specific signal transduction histidine kinase